MTACSYAVYVHVKVKGKVLHHKTIEKYYLYDETRNNNQLNDENTLEPNAIFRVLFQHDQWRTITIFQYSVIRQILQHIKLPSTYISSNIRRKFSLYGYPLRKNYNNFCISCSELIIEVIIFISRFMSSKLDHSQAFFLKGPAADTTDAPQP